MKFEPLSIKTIIDSNNLKLVKFMNTPEYLIIEDILLKECPFYLYVDYENRMARWTDDYGHYIEYKMIGRYDNNSIAFRLVGANFE